MCENAATQHDDSPVYRIFCDAKELNDLEQRRDYLSRACHDNPALRRDVESLLNAHESSVGRWLLAQETISVPGYDSVEKIASGGMGVVWKAKCEETGQLV